MNGHVDLGLRVRATHGQIFLIVATAGRPSASIGCCSSIGVMSAHNGPPAPPTPHPHPQRKRRDTGHGPLSDVTRGYSVKSINDEPSMIIRGLCGLGVAFRRRACACDAQAALTSGARKANLDRFFDNQLDRRLTRASFARTCGKTSVDQAGSFVALPLAKAHSLKSLHLAKDASQPIPSNSSTWYFRADTTSKLV